MEPAKGRIFKCNCVIFAIRCYFDKINLKQSDFCIPYSLKILASEQKYKNNLENRESMILPRSLKWKSVFFKSVLSSASENSRPVARDYVKSSQRRNETPLQLYRSFFHAGTGMIFLFLDAKFINVFQMFLCWMAANFQICSVKFLLLIQFWIHNGRRIRCKGGFPLANLFGWIKKYFAYVFFHFKQ